MSRFSSRKFLLAVATMLVSSGLLSLDMITALIWRDVVIATVGAYIAGNVAQKATSKESAT